jgi:hypothetical protein
MLFNRDRLASNYLDPALALESILDQYPQKIGTRKSGTRVPGSKYFLLLDS